ncbi:MAG: flagellar hook-basal body complex protein [Opitutales bacterium]|nr:flagellar hook-basal body complex protein [Opitutales bacterium]
MALSGSLGAGVAALKSFSKGLEVIGNNIANSSTVGYKGQRIEYGESFNNILQRSSTAGGASSSASQIGSGVNVVTTQGLFNQGTLTNTGLATDVGISGEGYFRVVDPNDGSTFITRAGNFRVDSLGYLVTQSGLRVQGLTGGTATFIATGTRLGTGEQAPAVVVEPASITDGEINAVLPIVVPIGSGGSGYDADNPPEITIQGDGFGARATADVDPDTGAVIAIKILNGGRGYTSASIIIGKPPGSDIAFSLQEQNLPDTYGDVRISMPDLNVADGIQFNNNTDDALNPGNPFANELLVEHFPGLQSFAVSSTGDVQLLLDNGDYFTVGQVLMTNVADPQALIREGDNLYSGAAVAGITIENGVPGTAGLGTLQQGSLELSNVDMTEEFAELISVQRAFQAGSRIITTADTILQEVINLKR